MEIEAITKTQAEEILENKCLGKRTGAANAGITNGIQEMEERISGLEDAIEEIDVPVKENVKAKDS